MLWLFPGRAFSRRLLYPAFLVMICIAAAGQSACGQQSPLARWSRYAVNDCRQFVGAFTSEQNLYRFGLYIKGISLLSSQDEVLNGRIRTSYHSGYKTYLDIANEFGNPGYATRVSLGLIGFSLFTGSRRFQDAAFTSFESLMITRGIVTGLKGVVGRARPYYHLGAHDYSPFSNRESFPSLHTATAFAVITPWILYYPHPVTYALYLIPVSTAVARIGRDAHWTTDVIAGATIGTLIGYSLTRWHRGDDTSPDNKLTVSLSPTSLHFAYHFHL